MRKVFALVSAVFVASLCNCTLLFGLDAFDPRGDGGTASDDVDSAQLPPATDDEGGVDALAEADNESDLPAQLDASDETTADAFASYVDATDSAADASWTVDASRPPSTDAGRDAPVDTAPPFDAASCPAILLNPSPTVAASSTRTTNYANQATDKQFTTRWESTQQADEPSGTALPPQWIYLDFGAPVSVTRVRIDWQSACGQAYELQVSDNASTWVTLTNGSVVNGKMNGSLGAPTDWSTDVDTTGLSGIGRYLRVYGTQRCLTMYGYSIWEMEVYGHGVAGCGQGE
jgi:hypothetical protein